MIFSRVRNSRDRKRRRTAAGLDWLASGLGSLEPRVLLATTLNYFNLIHLTDLRNDPTYAGIDGSITVDGQQKPLSVAVLDTGFAFNHPLLAPAMVYQYDFYHNTPTQQDNDGHGTNVAGIIGARDPRLGVAQGVGLIGLRVFDDGTPHPMAPPQATEQALDWVINSVENGNPYNIIAVSMSLGHGHYTSADLGPGGQLDGDMEGQQLQRLQHDGVTSVVAAGNDYYHDQTSDSGTPGIFATLDVGAVWEGNDGEIAGADGSIDYSPGPDQITVFSQRPDTSNVIFAPGAFIAGPTPDGGVGEMLGTSQATPMVAGVVALMQSAAWDFGGQFLSPEDVRTIIQNTADPVVDSGANNNVQQTGRTLPRINAYDAVQAVRQYELTRQGHGGGGGGGNTQGDPNGSIANAVSVPALTGDLQPDPNNSGQFLPYEQAAFGTIGVDGGTIAVGNKDVDMFRIQTNYDGNVTIRTLPRDGTTVNTVLRLFDANGNQIALNDDDTADKTTYSRIDQFLTAGTYYVGVSGAGNSSYDPKTAGSGTAGDTGDFAITFALNNGDPNGVLPGAVAVPSLPQSYPGYIGYDYGKPVGGTDVDLFKVVASDNGWMTAATITNDPSGYCDTLVRAWLVNPDGSLQYLGFNDDKDPSAPNQGVGHSTDSFLAIHVLQGQTILFGVSDTQNASYSPTDLQNRSAGNGGTYGLQLNFLNADINGSIARARTDINLGTTFKGVIGGDGFTDVNNQPGLVSVGSRDIDFFAFTPTQSGVLEVDTQGQQIVLAAGSTYVDDSGNLTRLSQDMTFNPVGTTIRIFDANGKPLATSTDSGATASSVVQVKATANTTYYVGISAAGDDNYDPTVQGSGSPGPMGGYTAQVKMLAQHASDVILSADVVSTPSAPAQNELPIALGQTITGSIGLDGSFFRGSTDYDPYAFTAAHTGQIDIIAAPTGEWGVDPYLRVFDASGRQIAANDNAGPRTTASELIIPVTAGQLYHIVVSGHGNQVFDLQGHNVTAGSTGDYALSVKSVQPGTLQFSSATYSQAENGRTVTITVNRVGGSDGTVQVNFTTRDGSALANANYSPKSGTLTFGPKVTSQSIVIGVIDDGRPLGDATFYITLSSPGGGATLGNPVSATITIRETDPPNQAPPVLNPIPNQVVAPGSRLTVQVTASNPNPGDPLTYRLGNSAPAVAWIDPSTGAFSFTPTSAQAGNTYIIPIIVTDARAPSLSDTKTLTITVLTPPRVINQSVGHLKKKGTNVITVFFNQSMLPAAAGAAGNYILVTPIPVRGKKAHGPKSKPVSFTARYNAANNSVVLTLRKPTKDHLQLTVRKSVSAANGLTLGGDYTVKIQ
jgi:hypothetical protein